MPCPRISDIRGHAEPAGELDRQGDASLPVVPATEGSDRVGALIEPEVQVELRVGCERNRTIVGNRDARTQTEGPVRRSAVGETGRLPPLRTDVVIESGVWSERDGTQFDVIRCTEIDFVLIHRRVARGIGDVREVVENPPSRQRERTELVGVAQGHIQFPVALLGICPVPPRADTIPDVGGESAILPRAGAEPAADPVDAVAVAEHVHTAEHVKAVPPGGSVERPPFVVFFNNSDLLAARRFVVRDGDALRLRHRSSGADGARTGFIERFLTGGSAGFGLRMCQWNGQQRTCHDCCEFFHDVFFDWLCFGRRSGARTAARNVTSSIHASPKNFSQTPWSSVI